MGLFGWRRDKKAERLARTRQHLDDLLARGLVEKVLLLPAMLGGTDDPRNVTYLPRESAALKARFEERVKEAVQRLGAVSYAATPEYDDASLVPARLHLNAQGEGFSETATLDVTPFRNWARLD